MAHDSQARNATVGVRPFSGDGDKASLNVWLTKSENRNGHAFVGMIFVRDESSS
jgi:hypothetical protein